MRGGLEICSVSEAIATVPYFEHVEGMSSEEPGCWLWGFAQFCLAGNCSRMSESDRQMPNLLHEKVLRAGARAWNAWRLENPGLVPELNDLKMSVSERQFGRAHGGPIDLSRAELCRAELDQATLIEANLIGAVLIDADLSDARLDKADLRGANFSNTRLAYASFNHA